MATKKVKEVVEEPVVEEKPVQNNDQVTFDTSGPNDPRNLPVVDGASQPVIDINIPL